VPTTGQNNPSYLKYYEKVGYFFDHGPLWRLFASAGKKKKACQQICTDIFLLFEFIRNCQFSALKVWEIENHWFQFFKKN
jgi:hypothetical protein